MSGNRRWFAVFAALTLLLTTSAIAAAQDGRIEYVEGDVWIESGGQRSRADFGTPVRRGDLIVTGADGVAIVTVSGGSQIKMRENSVVSLESAASGAAVDLRRGGIFARVQRAAAGTRGRFEVRTPTVVAGVRGTEFFVAYGRTVENLPDVWLCVNEGSVEVSVAEVSSSTIVNEGEGINILSGLRATDPRFYEWTTDLNWNFDPNQGEVRDSTDLDEAYSDLLDQDYD